MNRHKDVYSTGLSLVLGRVLTTWCEQLSPPTLERYLEIGGFRGLERVAAEMTPLDVVAELRSSGLRDRTFLAEPVYLAWQRFQRRHGSGTLVVDATQYDARSQSYAFLLTRNPFGLVEGLLIAATACGATRCRLLLPPELHDIETGFLNALELARGRDLPHAKELEVELARDQAPSIEVDRPEADEQEASLAHHLETWYHAALVLSLGAAHFKTLGVEGQTGTCLLTTGGPLRSPGLVEAPLGVNLWHVVETLTGGMLESAEPKALSLDNGMGGFLPAPDTQVPLAPEEMAAAWVDPAPTTLWLLEKDACIVDQTRRALYTYWLLCEESSDARSLIARATRMVTEVTVGKGLESHMEELEALGRAMAARNLASAWPLLSALAYFRDEWLDHVRRDKCPSGRCIARKPAPCHQTCPSGIDIPSFLGLIGHQDHKEAVDIISKDNPLPYTCGLVCPAPCEDACLRGVMDEPIHIRAMKAVAAKHALEAGGYPKVRKARSTGKRIAIVGAGPAGLTAAFFLRKKGHDVVIFEGQKEAGGMLRYGIPAYRLPREALDEEVRRIQDMGVTIETGREIGHLDELRALDFDAVFLALGTQVARMIPIEGKDLPFVLGGLDFLRRVRAEENPLVGPRVVVVGGGNVAIDVALTSLRQGGRRVDMVCLEKRREMPAHESEIQTALAEGVAIHPSWGPVRISQDRVFTAQRCTRVFDERGRFSPLFDPERTMSIEADHVILAIGQATDLACVEVGSSVEVERGLICADPDTLKTHEPGVFAGGDVVHGPRTVVEAVRAGKQAAAAIHAYVYDRPVDTSWSVPTRRTEVEPLHTSARDRTNLTRPEIPVRAVEDRKGNFQQVELGLTDPMAQGEASRCLRCDLCIGCGLCQLVCSELGIEALRLAETPADRLAFNDFTRPSTRCVGCGACGVACPTGAIRIVDNDGVRRTVITGTVVREQTLIPCSRCGTPHMSQAYMDHLKRRVGPVAVAHVDRNLCPACARALRGEELGSWVA